MFFKYRSIKANFFIIIVSFGLSAVFLTGKSIAGCGGYTQCGAGEICQMTCPSLGCSSSPCCSLECVSYGGGDGPQTCQGGTSMSCADPGNGFCLESNHVGACTMVWPSKVVAGSPACGGGRSCQTDCNCCPAGQFNTCESGTYEHIYWSGYRNDNGNLKPTKECARAQDAFISTTRVWNDCVGEGEDRICRYTSTCKRCGCAPPPTCTIQGRKVVMPGNQQIAPATSQTVSVAGGTPGSSSANPYFISAPADGNHTASVTVPSGYTASYTLCYNDTGCHTYSYMGGSSANVDTTRCNGGYADLYWHFTPVVVCPAYQACPTECGLGPSTAQNGNCTTRACPGTAACPVDSPIGQHNYIDCSQSIGWSCDATDYSKTLRVEIYRDGPKDVGTYLGRLWASYYYAPLAYVCGGYANHGFIFPHDLIGTGTHSIYTYALNIGVGSDTYLDGTPQTVTCAPPPPAQPITGRVWEDLNGNNTMDSSDRYWGQPGNASCTSSVSSDVQVRDNAAGTNATFDCSGFDPSQPPVYTTPSHVASTSLSFNLIPPSGVSCLAWSPFPVKWEYTVCENASCTAKNVGSGTGCSATIASPSALYSNTLNWMVAQQSPRTISGTLYETTDPTTCSNNAALTLVPSGGLSVTAYDSAGTQKGLIATVNSSGAYSVGGLSSIDSFNSLYVNGALSDATHSYQLSCLKSVGVNCNKGSGASATNCTSTGVPATPTLAAASPTVSFGFSMFGNDRWFVAVDGDIYGDSISAYVAPAPAAASGFSPNIINTQNASSIGGFGFAAGTIDTISVGSNVSEKGGYAQALSVLPSYPPTDSWLNNFGFAAPGTPITASPSGNVFKEGAVYSFTPDQFNSILNSGSYSFEGGNTGAPAASIVYVVGTGSININNNFVSANNDKTLVVVTNLDVNISKDPAATLASYRVTGASQIDLVILSKKDISFASVYNETASTYDNPLMIYGSLISAGTINPNRNLGFVNNAEYPATAIRFYPYLMSLIAQYEAVYATTGPYTGLASFDVQFNYGN